MNVSRAKEQKEESESVFSGLQAESVQIEQQIAECTKHAAALGLRIDSLKEGTDRTADRAGSHS